MSKQEKIQKLKDHGVDLTGQEKVADLDLLLAELDTDEDAAPASEGQVADIEEAEKVKNSKQVRNGDRKEVTVRYINAELGLTDRVFSLADHGEEFLEVAKRFAKKFNGELDPE